MGLAARERRGSLSVRMDGAGEAHVSVRLSYPPWAVGALIVLRPGFLLSPWIVERRGPVPAWESALAALGLPWTLCLGRRVLRRLWEGGRQSEVPLEAGRGVPERL